MDTKSKLRIVVDWIHARQEFFFLFCFVFMKNKIPFCFKLWQTIFIQLNKYIQCCVFLFFWKYWYISEWILNFFLLFIMILFLRGCFTLYIYIVFSIFTMKFATDIIANNFFSSNRIKFLYLRKKSFIGGLIQLQRTRDVNSLLIEGSLLRYMVASMALAWSHMLKKKKQSR